MTVGDSLYSHERVIDLKLIQNPAGCDSDSDSPPRERSRDIRCIDLIWHGEFRGGHAVEIHADCAAHRPLPSRKGCAVIARRTMSLFAGFQVATPPDSAHGGSIAVVSAYLDLPPTSLGSRPGRAARGTDARALSGRPT